MFCAILLFHLAHQAAIDTDRLNEIVRSYVTEHKFAGSVLVARKGEVLYDRAFGMANWDWKRPNSPETKFRLGSITKQFTAAGILLLMERGKVKLDDSILKFFPNAPKAWGPITIWHLLRHQSGIPDIVDLPTYSVFERQKHTADQIRARFADLPLLFKPGSQERYSNSGYILLGQVIEKVSGEGYETFLRKNIFTPANMMRSGCDSTERVLPNWASGYVATKDGLQPAGYIDMSVPGGAGSLYSTSRDLLQWEVALFGGKILKSESLAQMTDPYDGVKRSATGIGMGLAIDETYGRRQIYFGGGIEGFNSWLAYDPADQTVIVALSNVNTLALESMCGQISSVSRGEKVVLTPERKEVKLKEESLHRFVGAYIISSSANLNIGLEAGSLYVQVDGQEKFSLHPEAPTRFFLKEFDAQAEFVPSKAGSWDLMWHQDGSTSLMKHK